MECLMACLCVDALCTIFQTRNNEPWLKTVVSSGGADTVAPAGWLFGFPLSDSEGATGDQTQWTARSEILFHM